jgi:hypothetical protein
MRWSWGRQDKTDEKVEFGSTAENIVREVLTETGAAKGKKEGDL